MTRAEGVIADAVIAVIAAQVHTHLNAEEMRVTAEETRAAAAAAVAQLCADGWQITVPPPRETPS